MYVTSVTQSFAKVNTFSFTFAKENVCAFYHVVLYLVWGDKMTVGSRIKSARKKAGLTQKQLGECLGISYQTIAQWENNLRNPKYTTLRRIAEALGVSAQYLLNGKYLGKITDYGNGIRVYSGASMHELDLMVADRQENSFKVVFHAPRVLITIDNNSNATQEQIDDVISLYRESKNTPTVHDIRVNSLLLAFSQLNIDGQIKAIERVDELTEIPKYQKDMKQSNSSDNS